MQVIKDGSNVRVDELQTGDRIHGISGVEKMESTSCRVIALHDVGKEKTVDQLTPDHYILDNDIMRPYRPQGDSVGEEKVERIYTLLTSCDAVTRADETIVSPFSGAFCRRSISWKENVEMAGILRDALELAPFLDLNMYVDTEDRGWNSMLHPLCDAILMCLSPEECDDRQCADCDELRAVFKTFVRYHIDESYRHHFTAYCKEHPDRCAPKQQRRLQDNTSWDAFQDMMDEAAPFIVRKNRIHDSKAFIIGLVMSVVSLLLLIVCAAFMIRHVWSTESVKATVGEIQEQPEKPVVNDVSV